MSPQDSASPDPAAETSAIIEIGAGQLFDNRFEIIETIGSGGTSRVFRALDKTLDRVVALKVLSPEAGSEANLARFRRELQTTSKLEHENIVKVFSTGTSTGLPYLAMELLEGPTLAEFMRQSPINADQFALICRQVLDGLEYAHSQGVLHRDLKPSNIMLLQKDRLVAKLVDFGIARTMGDADIKHTQTGVLLGTPLYMSPEQCSGKPVDIRSDIYSLACVMFEMSCGTPPFNGGSAFEVMYKHIHDQPPEPSGQITTTEQNKVIRRALAKQADERPKSARQMQDWLFSCEGLPTGSKARTKKVAPIAALLLVPIAGVLLWSWQTIKQARKDENEKTLQAVSFLVAPKTEGQLRVFAESWAGKISTAEGIEQKRKYQKELVTTLRGWLDRETRTEQQKDDTRLLLVTSVNPSLKFLPDDLLKPVEQSVDLLLKGELGRAERARLFAIRSRIQTRHGETKRAISSLLQAVELESKMPEKKKFVTTDIYSAFEALMNDRMQHNDPATTELLGKKCAIFSSKIPEVWTLATRLLVLRALLTQGKLDECKICLDDLRAVVKRCQNDKHVDTNPIKSDMYMIEGHMLETQGKTRDALACYNNSLKIAQDNNDKARILDSKIGINATRIKHGEDARPLVKELAEDLEALRQKQLPAADMAWRGKTIGMLAAAVDRPLATKILQQSIDDYKTTTPEEANALQRVLDSWTRSD